MFHFTGIGNYLHLRSIGTNNSSSNQFWEIPAI